MCFLRTTSGSLGLNAIAPTHLQLGIMDLSLHVAVSSHRLAVSSLQESKTMHNTTLIGVFEDLGGPPVIHSSASKSAELVRPEKVTNPRRISCTLFSISAWNTPRNRRNRRCYVPAEILEQRQLLSDDPISELNTKFTLAIGTSNAQIDAFFNSGSTDAAGGLNGALGGAAAKFNQLPMNGSEIEDAALTAVSTQFGAAESRVRSATNTIKGAKPVIAFPESFNLGVLYNMPMMMMPGMQMGSHGYSYVNMFNGDFYGVSNWVVEVPSSTPGVMASRLSMQGTISRSNQVETWNINSDWTQQVPGGNVAYHIEYANSGSSSSEILKFSGSQTSGQITTYASADIVGGVTNYYNFGGSANLGDITASFSKSHMYQTDRLFGSIEYLSGNTKASAQLTQITSPNANVTAIASVFSLLNNQDEP